MGREGESISAVSRGTRWCDEWGQRGVQRTVVPRIKIHEVHALVRQSGGARDRVIAARGDWVLTTQPERGCHRPLLVLVVGLPEWIEETVGKGKRVESGVEGAERKESVGKGVVRHVKVVAEST